MRRPGLVIAIALLSGVIGFLVGRIAPEGGRAERRAAPRDTMPMVELPPEAYAALQAAAEREQALEKENRQLRAAQPAESPARQAPPAEVPGTRREDGTIVGGASWPAQTRLLAIGYLSGPVEDFFRKANLTETQKQKLRAELEQRISDVMQISADYANGDLDGDAAYDALGKIVAKGRGAAAQVLDDRQLAIFNEFETGIGDFNRNNIVQNELTTLRQELGLDREQERLVKTVIDDRYRRVQDRFQAPLPNMFFQPIRRAGDKDIYDETGAAIRGYLRPEQRAAYDAAEAKAATAVFGYRSLLVPKPPGN
ncbi:MAG TPA: hypothetical protein VFY93_07785 [Planctomycetota bacterium]|nr:hypothetical protein [Planctomycetota bacterium]